MQKGNKTVIAVIAVAIALAAAGAVAFFFMSNKSAAPKASDQTETTTTTETPTNNTTSETDGTVISYTDSGFSPDSLTIKAGTSVTVKNNSTMQLEFASGDHPTHTKEPELNTKTIGPGESTSFTPTKTGTWSFHNHFNSSDTGTLIVE